MMLKRHFYSLFVVLTLLLAQHGAAWHALSHYGEPVSHSEPDQNSAHTDVCELCHVFSQMGAAVSGAWVPGVLSEAGMALSTVVSVTVPAYPRFNYHSRAPPFLV